MIGILVLLTSLHIFFFLWLRREWISIPEYHIKNNDTPGVSIIIPVRNECNTIQNIVNSISNQDYPLDKIEIIIIDDHSTDNTIEVIQSITALVKMNLFTLRKNEYGKKAAIAYGISHAANSIILCTDADCLVPHKWVKSIVGFMLENDLKMVTGPVKMNGNTLFEQIQSIEFEGLIGYGAITLKNNKPSICNGANIAYLKDVFEEVGGYNGNGHIPSGDDEFLLQKFFARYPNQIRFLKSKEATVVTPSKKSLSALISQRVRWTSKWRFHKSIFIRSSAVFGFFDFLLSILMYLFLFIYYNWQLIGGLIVLRIVSEVIYLKKTGKYFDISGSIYIHVLVSLIYPFYAVLLGIGSIFGKYSWKGRNY